jgi:hypothetical protein
MPGTNRVMVPGHPKSLVACRYYGGNLAGTGTFPPADVADALNSAPRVPSGAVFHCPIDFGEKIVLHFGYADGSELEVSVSTRGCEFATNGNRTVRVPSNLLTHLEAALGRDTR